MADRQNIIVVGVSTRSAAASCVRAGLHPICLDLFGDRDLREYAEVNVLRDLDNADPFLDSLAATNSCETPVMYTGGVENRPTLIRRLESRWELWGCGEHAVRAVRDPLALARALRSVGIAALKVQLEPPATGGNWLKKPLRSGGGLGITQWKGNSQLDRSSLESTDAYFQEYREGESMSALFAASVSLPGLCELLGVCRQLIGDEALHAQPFGWCGSIGPVNLDDGIRAQLVEAGKTLHRSFHLAGLFGIDLILDDQGTPWITEVNPRYTGSTEVLELALQTSLIRSHAVCFRGDVPFSDARWTIGEGSALPWSSDTRQCYNVVGKAVLFAPRDIVANTTEWPIAMPERTLPALVDVPMPGEQIAKGAPVCTLLAEADSAGECQHKLRQLAREIEARLD